MAFEVAGGKRRRNQARLSRSSRGVDVWSMSVGEPADRDRHDPAPGFGRRAGDRQAGDLVRVARGDVDRQVAAERQPAQDRPTAGRLVDDPGDLVDGLVPVERPVAERAMTGQVERDHPEPTRQRDELRVPHTA